MLRGRPLAVVVVVAAVAAVAAAAVGVVAAHFGVTGPYKKKECSPESVLKPIQKI